MSEQPETTEEVATPTPAPVAPVDDKFDFNDAASALVNGAVKHAPWSAGMALVIAVFFYFAGPTIDRYFDIKEKECASLEEMTARMEKVEGDVSDMQGWTIEHEKRVLEHLVQINATVSRLAGSPSGGTNQ